MKYFVLQKEKDGLSFFVIKKYFICAKKVFSQKRTFFYRKRFFYEYSQNVNKL